jgi:hypothetical protein
MSQLSSKVLLLAPVLAMSLMGCGDGADTLAPNDNRVQQCRAGTTGARTSAKCAQLGLHTMPGHATAQHL